MTNVEIRMTKETRMTNVRMSKERFGTTAFVIWSFEFRHYFDIRISTFGIRVKAGRPGRPRFPSRRYRTWARSSRPPAGQRREPWPTPDGHPRPRANAADGGTSGCRNIPARPKGC